MKASPSPVTLGVMTLLALAGCRRAGNYLGPVPPRYEGGTIIRSAVAANPAELRVVTFNIRYAREIDSAIALFRSTGELSGADIIALQEMDASGTQRIAEALGMQYIYYPGSVHPISKKDYGNAILSRWPIVNDRRIALPHWDRFEHLQRTATAATIAVGEFHVRVYSIHLSTWVNAGPASKRAQVHTVLGDAETYPLVIIAGDLNGRGIGKELARGGYLWLTEHNPPTNRWWRWDHVFVRGAALADSVQTGVIKANHHASDHRPVWAVVPLPVVNLPVGVR